MAATYSRDRRQGSNQEARVFEVVWRSYKDGDRDLLDAGVPLDTIDSELCVDREVVRKILDRLADSGVLVRLSGANPETYRARISYAPAVLHDGGEGR